MVDPESTPDFPALVMQSQLATERRSAIRWHHRAMRGHLVVEFPFQPVAVEPMMNAPPESAHLFLLQAVRRIA